MILRSDSSSVLGALFLLGLLAALLRALFRRTRTGKLRAGASDADERGPGPDYAIYKAPRLPKRAERVYVYLTAIADPDGYCFPFYQTIAKRTGLSTSTVSKAIRDLEKAGLLTRQQRVSRRGGSSDLYHVKRISQLGNLNGSGDR
jgi:GntR family transcriptional regulator